MCLVLSARPKVQSARRPVEGRSVPCPRLNRSSEPADAEKKGEEMSDEVKVTVLPPGRAEGCDDLRQWGSRRLVGKAGVWDKKDKTGKKRAWLSRPLPRGSFAR